MALTSGSKILVSDISTALGGKIDTAGTGLSKSGTTLALATVTTSGGTAGPTANATPSYDSTFTVPKVVYDKYGRVTGHTNYTVKIPAAPSVTNISGTAATATAIPNVSNFAVQTATTWNIPSGGRWACLYKNNIGGDISYYSKNVSGGTAISKVEWGFAVRIA